MMGAVSTGAPRPALSSGAATACRDGTLLFAGLRAIAPASADVIAGVMAGCGRLGRRRAACAKAPPYSGPLADGFGLRGRRQHHCAQPGGSSWRTPVRTVRRCRPER
jgi:hypothetical protein